MFANKRRHASDRTQEERSRVSVLPSQKTRNFSFVKHAFRPLKPFKEWRIGQVIHSFEKPPRRSISLWAEKLGVPGYWRYIRRTNIVHFMGLDFQAKRKFLAIILKYQTN